MKRYLIIVTAAVFLYFFISAPLFCQAGSSNPFFKGTENSSVSGKVPVKNSSFIEKITGIQKQLNNKTAAVITDYRENRNIDLLLLIAGFSFIYGVIHAMTPGHGKNVILAWILTSERTFIKVLLTAVTGMIFHVFNSVIMVYLIWYLIKGKLSVQSPLFIKYFSFAACLILFIISFKSLYDIFRKQHKNSREQNSSPGSIDKGPGQKTDSRLNHTHNLEKITTDTSYKECLMISLGIGMVPCPVAAILTVFMISGNLFTESLLTAVFFCGGMASTLVIYTAAVWLLRSFISGVKNRHLVRIRDYVLPAAGSILLMFSGFIIISPYIKF